MILELYKFFNPRLFSNSFGTIVFSIDANKFFFKGFPSSSFSENEYKPTFEGKNVLPDEAKVFKIPLLTPPSSAEKPN